MIISEISEGQIHRALKVIVDVLAKTLQRGRTKSVCVCKIKRLMEFLL